MYNWLQFEEKDANNFSESSEYSSDDDEKWTKELKSEYKSAKMKRIMTEYKKSKSDDSNIQNEHTGPKFYELKENEEFVNSNHTLSHSE